MEKFLFLLLALGCTAALLVGFSSRANMRIGTYDSRAVAIAFGNSSEGMQFVSNLRAEMMKAREAGNDSLVRHIENKAGVYQKLNHLRAFSIGSVSEILQNHEAEVAAVAEEAGVQALVSKFELIYTGMGVDTVDVTLALTRIFKPSEQVQKWISGVPNQKPLPMADALALPAGK